MSDATVRQFRETDRGDVIALWGHCDLLRPWNDPDRDIDRKLTVDDSMFLIAESDGRLVGTVMPGYDGHRGWINFLAVDPTLQGGGLGALLMGSAEQLLGDLGCAKINLQIRNENVGAAAFYEKLGYTVDEAISMGKRLVDDVPPTQ